MATYSKNGVKKEIIGKLRRHFSREVAEASREQIYQACALVIRDALTDRMIETQNEIREQGEPAGALPVHGIPDRAIPAKQCV